MFAGLFHRPKVQKVYIVSAEMGGVGGGVFLVLGEDREGRGLVRTAADAPINALFPSPQEAASSKSGGAAPAASLFGAPSAAQLWRSALRDLHIRWRMHQMPLIQLWRQHDQRTLPALRPRVHRLLKGR